MPYYLVSFALNQAYFDAPSDKRESLTKQEIAYGIDLYKRGVWRHGYDTPGNVKTQSWAIYKTANQGDLEKYLASYAMDQAGMYTKTISEVTIQDPSWIVGLLFKTLRLLGLFRPQIR